MLAMMYLCSNASVNRRKKKKKKKKNNNNKQTKNKASEGTEKKIAKTFNDPDQIICLLVFMTTIKWAGVLQKILTFYWEILMETFWLHFVERIE